MCLALACLALVSCTKKLEEDTADLKKRTGELKSLQGVEEKRLDEVKSKLAQVEADLKALPSKIDPKLDAANNESKSRDAKLSEDVAKLGGKLDQALAAIKKLEDEIVAMKQREEERRKADALKKVELENKTRIKADYAKASQVILDECKAALGAPPFKATEMVSQVKKDFESLRARLPEQQGTVVDERLAEVINMVKERASGTAIPPVADKTANEIGFYKRIVARIEDAQNEITALLADEN